MKQKVRDANRRRRERIAADAKKRMEKVKVADPDGLTRYKVKIVHAFSRTFITKAVNEEQAVKQVQEGFGTMCHQQQPEIVDIAVLDMSAAEAKGRIEESKAGEGLIEVVKE